MSDDATIRAFIDKAMKADAALIGAAAVAALTKGWGVVVLERDGRVTDAQPSPFAPANTILHIPADGLDAFIERQANT